MLNTKYTILYAYVGIALIFFSFVPLRTHAQESSLTVSPPLLEIELNPPGQIETPIRIRNDSSEPVRLTIQLKPFTAYGESGDIQFLRENDAFPGANPKITNHIKIRQDSTPITEISLAPKEEKTLDLYVGLDKDEPHSDYYFSIVFLPVANPAEEVPDDESPNGSTIQGGIAINTLLSVGPKDQPKALIEEFSSPRFLQSGPVPFTVRVKNTGNRYITPTGTIIITNMFGQNIGRVNLMAANILPGTVRAFINEDLVKEILKTQADQENGNASTNEQMPTFTALWPETFLMGPYTATLRVSLSDTGPEITRQYRFFAAPVQLIIGLIILTLLLFVIKKRIRARTE